VALVVKRLLATALVAILVGGAALSAQRFYGDRRRMPPRFPSGPATHRLFTFARAQYQSTHREQGGQGWFTDYPDADVNFSIRLSELTRTPVGFANNDYPDHVVVELTDPELFNYPFLFMSDVGTAYFSPEEAERLGDRHPDHRPDSPRDVRCVRGTPGAFYPAFSSLRWSDDVRTRPTE
jgi:hypothetical protein